MNALAVMMLLCAEMILLLFQELIRESYASSPAIRGIKGGIVARAC
jgi:hypothetical protein